MSRAIRLPAPRVCAPRSSAIFRSSWVRPARQPRRRPAFAEQENPRPALASRPRAGDHAVVGAKAASTLAEAAEVALLAAFFVDEGSPAAARAQVGLHREVRQLPGLYNLILEAVGVVA